MPENMLKLYPRTDESWSKSTRVYEDIELPRSGRGGTNRPYVAINMVSSIDGKTAVGGKASGIGAAADRNAMRTLRSKVDAVMIGAGTLRAERLSLGLDASDSGPSPLGIILSTTGDVPLESNLVRYKSQKIVVLLGESAGESACARLGRYADVLRVKSNASGRVDLTSAIEALKRECAVARLLVEGGPTLNHALISASLADEIFITLAPTLLGQSDAQTVLGGALDEPQSLRLLDAYLAADELFLRYALQQ